MARQRVIKSICLTCYRKTLWSTSINFKASGFCWILICLNPSYIKTAFVRKQSRESRVLCRWQNENQNLWWRQALRCIVMLSPTLGCLHSFPSACDQVTPLLLTWVPVNGLLGFIPSTLETQKEFLAPSCNLIIAGIWGVINEQRILVHLPPLCHCLSSE